MDAKLKVLYEDNHLIAVWKDAGILTQGDISGDRSLMDGVKDYLKKKYNKPGAVFLGLIHRLDRPVAGIVLFAKTSKGASRLSEQFRTRSIKKIYYALVEGQPRKPAQIIRSKISKIQKGRFYSAKIGAASDLADAILKFDTVKTYKKNTLIRIQLHTGKFHQIRAQLSAAGIPIVGDVKYGAQKIDNLNGIALAECELTFKTPTSGIVIALKQPAPAEWETIAK